MVCIIEFSGRPGAGKTSLCKAVHNELCEEHKDIKIQKFLASKNQVARFFFKLLLPVIYWTFHQERFQEIKRAVRRTLPRNERKRFILSVVNALQIDQFLTRARLARTSVVLLDQGFTQLCWSNVALHDLRHFREPLLLLYRPFLTGPLNIVFVNTDIVTHHHNLSLRNDLRGCDSLFAEAFSHSAFESFIIPLHDLNNVYPLEFNNCVVDVIDLNHLMSSIILQSRPMVNPHGEADSATTYCSDRNHII
ncbi:ATP-binding protein [Halomonas organivorans]